MFIIMIADDQAPKTHEKKKAYKNNGTFIFTPSFLYFFLALIHLTDANVEDRNIL